MERAWCLGLVNRKLIFLAIFFRCNPWCWYIESYTRLGDFGQGQMLENIPAPWFAYGIQIRSKKYSISIHHCHNLIKSVHLSSRIPYSHPQFSQYSILPPLMAKINNFPTLDGSYIPMYTPTVDDSYIPSYCSTFGTIDNIQIGIFQRLYKFIYTNWHIPTYLFITTVEWQSTNSLPQLIPSPSRPSRPRTGETRPPGWSSERCSSFPTPRPSPPALWSPCFCGMLGDGSPEGEMCSQKSMKSGGRYV